ncbi:MAG: hypothetical protein DHS20C01_33690 [marine bacterium B5-7]|nr:MAG: hypothetical protein DHS20C01_33690 [marine bacterium B5-7]
MCEYRIRPLGLSETDPKYGFRRHLIGAGLLMLISTPTVQAGDSSLFFAGPEVCPADIIDIPEAVAKSAGLDPDTQDVILESDQIDAPDSNTLVLTGNAQVIQGSQAIFAQEIVYDKESYTVNARDDVTLYSPKGDKLNAATLMLEMETFIGDADNVDFQLGKRANSKRKRKQKDSGEFRQTGFGTNGLSSLDDNDLESIDWSIEDLLDDKKDKKKSDVEEAVVNKGPVRARMRGEAEKIFFEGSNRQRLVRARMTTCPIGKESVYIKAREVTLDHATGVGVGKGMSVRFFHVPIFYFPRMSFPINDERKTGFLFPSIGTSDTSGAIVEVPYYINIAPEMDATINMRYLSDRGVQVMGEYRYLGEEYDGIFRAAYLPGDDIYGDDRYALSYDHRHRFGEDKRWDANVDVETVSDTEYLDDFANDVNLSSASFLSQRAEVRYSGEIVRFGASVLDYESVDSALDENFQPYERLPRLTLNASSPRRRDAMLEYGVDSELVNFSHPGDRVDGVRLDATPWVSLPIDAVYGYVTPKLSVRHTTYNLDNVLPGTEDNPNRTVPIFSVDSGIVFERDTSWNGRPHYQTLEPRLYYVYAPEKDQDDIPLFDTGGGNLSNISNFFRDNRFFGADRVGDENRLTVGVTSRLIDTDNGRQRMEAEIAQIFYFSDRIVQLTPGEAPDTESTSNLLAQIRANLTPRWEVGSSVEYNYEDSEVEVFRVDTQYVDGDRRRFGASYWDFNNSSEQLDLSLNWPIASKWQFGMATLYDIKESENLATSASITYDACCWAWRISGEQRRHRNTQDETSVFLTLELKDLGRFSSSY